MYGEFDSKQDAYKYEKLVKSYKGGNGFKKILNGEVAELAPPRRGKDESASSIKGYVATNALRIHIKKQR